MIDKQKLIEAGGVAKKAHAAAANVIKPNASVMEIERVVATVIKNSGMKPAFLGYKNYPAVTCVSVNDEIVHGIPSEIILKDGDIVAVDLGVENDGAIVDTARTHPVGKVSERNSNLLSTTKKALEEGIKQAKIGNKTGDIGYIVERVVKSAGFYVVKDLTGHGVGPTLQEPPSIPNFGKPGTGSPINEGMVLAIEPITATKNTRIAIKSDNWTIAALDDCMTAHFEDTVLITKEGPVVLT